VPLLKFCPRCPCTIELSRRLCPDCQRADDRRRNAKRRASGRTTAAWQRLRLAALHRDGYACRRCGRTGTRHTLTVHLRPELGGNHRIAALDDLTTLCRSCHGSIDAPRAQGGVTTTSFSGSELPAPRPRFSRSTLKNVKGSQKVAREARFFGSASHAPRTSFWRKKRTKNGNGK
jgi:hypothetical protein